MSLPHRLPAPHPWRVALHNEIHARPPEAMVAPLSISHVVLLCDAAQREASRAHLATLLREHGLPPPDPEGTHLRVRLAGLHLRWELHTEFVSWTFSCAIEPEGFGQREPETAWERPPPEWLASLPGQLLAGLHLWIVRAAKGTGPGALLPHVLREDSLVGSGVDEGQAEVYADLALREDGFTRMVLLAGDMPPRRLGRLAQQLIEIDSYRMMALLALPVARQAFAALGRAEGDLAALAGGIREAARHDEPKLLDRLTLLAGEIESQYAASHSRFSASSAYFQLVDRRVADIDEARLPGLQTLGEFILRRLAPARSTCEWAARRQDALSQRVSRASNLLRTRVEIEQQESNQQLLAAMNRRQALQLRLQSTVEGLSVAAITYYIAGLVSYLAKGAQAWGWPFSAESTAATAIPVVAVAVWASLRRLHASVKDDA